MRLLGLQRHVLFLVYMASLVWLLLSCLYFARSADVPLDFVAPLLVFGGVLALSYLFLCWALRNWRGEFVLSPLPEAQVQVLIFTLLVVFCAVVVMHLTTLGYVPTLRAYTLENDYDIARVRQEAYYKLAVWQRYAYDYAIKGVGPVLLVLAAHYRSRLFYPALAVGLFYASSLFVKVLAVYLLMPLVLYFLLNRSWRRAVTVLMLMIASILLNWTASSTVLRGEVRSLLGPLTVIVDNMSADGSDTVADGNSMGVEQDPAGGQQTWDGAQDTMGPSDFDGVIPGESPGSPEAQPISKFPGSTFVTSLRERMVIVPARVAWQWYTQYRNPEYRENGCGYRLLARVLGCDYVHMPAKLYAIYYPDLVRDRGLNGSLNSGSYMHDFANFGYSGVLVSAILFGIIFTGLRYLCGTSSTLLSVNLMPVISLSEMPMSTVLNSGGWLLIIGVTFLLQYGGMLFRKKQQVGSF